MDSPFGLLAELTYRCPLACAYCSNPLNLADYAGELTTGEWRRGLTQARDPGRVPLDPAGGGPPPPPDGAGNPAHAPAPRALTPTRARGPRDPPAAGRRARAAC